MLNLDTKIKKLNYVGPKYVKKLHKVGINTIRDLLFYFPHRYDDFSDISSVTKISPNEENTIQGKIKSVKNTKSPKKGMTLTKALVEDDTAAIEAVWFNQPYLLKTLKEGSVVNLSGEVSFDGQRLVFSNPAYEILKKPDEKNIKKDYVHTGRLVPVYHETKGLSSRYLRFIISKNLNLADKIKDFLPPAVKNNLDLLELRQAVKQIHFPENKKAAEKAKRRLIFNEIFLIQLLLLQKKKSYRKKPAYKIPFHKETTQEFVKNLPFKLTDAQRKASWEIIQDIQKSYPMRRLLEGDVGSGKTIVAALAILNVAKQNYQTAFMAPTEVLAFQHFRELKKDLSSFDVKISLLTGTQQKLHISSKEKTKNIKKQALLKKIKKGKTKLVIGTHALIQDKVNFNKLALTIVDEQHRFGIKQRGKLLEPSTKSSQSENTKYQILDTKYQEKTPHLLSMTATPIPRTLSLALYGDLDISQLDELPAGRKKIKTKLVPPARRDAAYDFIREEINSGRQAFVICPLIEESEELDSKAAEEEYKKLSGKVYPDLNIGLLHGQLPSEEKKDIMKQFKDGDIDILVSTSVIEVGVDIPNASVMVIEGAERFGLAQLHQFRGRVGRSSHQSYCFLFTNSAAKNTRKRLDALVNIHDGFKLAEKDLEIRGPGDFIGTRQSGEADLTMASLKDINTIKKARNQARYILQKSPELKDYPELKKKLASFHKEAHLE